MNESMKKKLLIIVFALMGTGLMAQPFAEGAQAVNLGLGFGQTLFVGSGYGFSFPGIMASYEYGLKEIPMGPHLNGVISVGGFAGWLQNTYKYQFWVDDVRLIYNSFLFSARGNYHFIFHEKIDTYAGITLGYSVINSKYKGGSIPAGQFTPQTGSFQGGGYIGGRYYFSDYLAVYAELGWMLAVLQVGVTYRLYK